MNRRQMLAAGAASIVAAGAPPGRAAGIRPPNFIVIYCDDLGYGDIGPMGGTTIPTPQLDRMAREGLVLTDFYAPANVCTPSRAGLLTGRYPIRTGLSNVLLANSTERLPASEVTIAQALRPAYTSALIGKWHLGHSGANWDATHYGFDLFYGLPFSHDIPGLKVFEFDRTGQTGEWEPDFPQLQQQFHARAERFIADNHDRPFFLELALSAPHLPNYPADPFAGQSQAAGAYGDTVMEIDGIVGRLLDQLQALGIDQDTLVVFSSDNGPWFEGSNGPLRSRKGGAGYDGGYRVPFVARWPGRVPAGVRSNAIAMGIDLLPTFCALAGLPQPAGVELDGMDISAVLTRNGASPHQELVLFNGEDVVGIRSQQWKYVNADYYHGMLMLLEGRGYPQLYAMNDPTEQYSVASVHPDVARAMQARLEQAAARFAPLRKGEPGPLQRQRAAQPGRHVPQIWQD